MIIYIIFLCLYLTVEQVQLDETFVPHRWTNMSASTLSDNEAVGNGLNRQETKVVNQDLPSYYHHPREPSVSDTDDKSNLGEKYLFPYTGKSYLLLLYHFQAVAGLTARALSFLFFFFKYFTFHFFPCLYSSFSKNPPNSTNHDKVPEGSQSPFCIWHTLYLLHPPYLPHFFDVPDHF